jgi:hypothetical protein
VPGSGTVTLTVRDPPFQNATATTLYVELARGNRLDNDGTFADADSMFMAQPLSAGGNNYEYDFGPPFTEFPGTYYWQALRYDCIAQPDCYVTNGQIRSFTVDAESGGGAPSDPCADERTTLRRATKRLRRANKALLRAIRTLGDADTATEKRRAEQLVRKAKRHAQKAKRRVKKARHALAACG